MKLLWHTVSFLVHQFCIYERGSYAVGMHATPISSKKLTGYEWDGLTKTYNLADGHPRQALTPSQQDALQDMFSVFKLAHQSQEPQAKKRFETAFFTLAGQKSVLNGPAPLAQYSGSSAIELLANYLRLHKKKVALLHPTFDSIADTLRRHSVPLTPLSEEILQTLRPSSKKMPVDAIYIVLPNNPTGRSLTRQQFENVVAYCKRHQLLLIIDFCFRFYGDFWDYDQYAIMREAGIDFITTEDTGKSFPAADVKLGMVVSSASLYDRLKAISDDFLLSVSPFVFSVLTSYISVEQATKRRLAGQDIIDQNRQALRAALQGSAIETASGDTNMSVEWLQLPDDWHCLPFTEKLAKAGLQVLPGEYFYWHRHADGRHSIRIALLRDPDYFQHAIRRLVEFAGNYRP